MIKNPQHFLLSQTANIGDMIYTLPVIGILKEHYPDSKISLIAKNYTKPVTDSFGKIDHFIGWEAFSDLPQQRAIEELKALKADVFINIFPELKAAKIAKQAKIKHRIGNCRQWKHWPYYNKRLCFSRNHGDRHEYQNNLKFLAPLSLNIDSSIKTVAPYFNLKINQSEQISDLLDKDRFNLIIHPGSHGHGREWPVDYFKQLINQLPNDQFKIFLTGTDKENQQFSNTLIKDCPTAINVMGRFSLIEFMAFIQSCDGIVASGTGPLHLGAVLGIHTLGLFPALRHIGPTRWAPIGENAEYLVSNDPCRNCNDYTSCACMQKISVQQVKNKLLSWRHQEA